MATAEAAARHDVALPERSGPWTDLGLTLPVFVAYHLAVVFLPVRNAADLVTRQLVELAEHDLVLYVALTVSIGAVFVGVLWAAGRSKVLRWERFLWVATEGVVYAVAMRLVAAYVVGKLALSVGATALPQPVTAVVMSLGAGFYEEVAFRVLAYGLGLRALFFLFDIRLAANRLTVNLVWMLATAVLFSAWHHLGVGGEPFELRVFVFRAVCGVVFAVIYAFRGFAPVVWTHLLYDAWVLLA